MSNTRSILSLLVLATTTVVIRGFAFVPSSHHQVCKTTSLTTAPLSQRRYTTTRLYAEEEATEAEAATKEEEDEEEKKEEEESPEMVALKKEIASLEAELATKRQEVSSMEDEADKYTKEGYVRRVAELETVKRMTSAVQSSGKESNMAAVLKEFLPVLDDLNGKQEKYKDDDFGKKYQVLSIMEELTKMGVTTLEVTEGSKADPIMVEATLEEYSDTVEKGCVISSVASGLVLKGHVIRPAKAVVSLGKEEPEEEEKKEEEEAPAEESEAASEEE